MSRAKKAAVAVAPVLTLAPSVAQTTRITQSDLDHIEKCIQAEDAKGGSTLQSIVSWVEYRLRTNQSDAVDASDLLSIVGVLVETYEKERDTKTKELATEEQLSVEAQEELEKLREELTDVRAELNSEIASRRYAEELSASRLAHAEMLEGELAHLKDLLATAKIATPPSTPVVEVAPAPAPTVVDAKPARAPKAPKVAKVKAVPVRASLLASWPTMVRGR